MLRGFRWQFLALTLAVALFIASLVVRNQPQPNPISSPAPIATDSVPTLTPAPQIDVQVAVSPTAPPDVQGSADTFREGLVGNLGRINPLFVSMNSVDRDIAALIFEGLTRTNQYGEPQPLLASRWVVSSDGLEYVFTLRDDVLWQDGMPFTASDVAYTMSLLRDPAFPGDPEIGRFWRTVETEVLGDHIVRFRLTQPLGTFLDKVQIGIVPEHALRGTTAGQIAAHPINLAPIGTGAYQLESIVGAPDTPIRLLTLRAAPLYRDQRGSAPERIELSIYSSFDEALASLSASRIDALATSNSEQRLKLLQAASADQNYQIYTQTQTTLGVLVFNWAREDAPFLREQRVRVALQAGLDRRAIVDRNLSDVAVIANSPLFPGSYAYLAELPWQPFDPAQALAQLNIASERLQLNQTPTPEETPADQAQTLFGLSILTPDTPSLISLATEIATQWSQLNLSVTIDVVDMEAYRQRLNSGDFVVALVEYALGSSADPDVYTFWNQGQTPPEGSNYGAADDGRISELLERARREPSGINRITLYREFQQEFASRSIAIPLYYPLFTYAVSTRYTDIQLGFMGNPADRFRTIITELPVPSN